MRGIARTYDRSDPVYRYIVEYTIASGGRTPRVRDIMAGCGLSSTSVVRYRLCGLEGEGLIRCEDRISGGITVVGGKWIPPEGYSVNA